MHKADVFGETAFLWNGDVLLSETRRHWQKLYVYEPDSFRPLALVQNQRVYFYHLDHLGTPQELTDVEGQVVWNVRYRAYGNVVEKEVEQVENNLRFQGQYFDAETGLHYNRFRYYDPQVGQFVQPDPIGLVGGENLYQYAPNPMGWVDPWGLRTCLQTGGHTVKPGTARALNEYFYENLHSREWGRAIEALKEAEGLSPAHHGKIWSNGDYTDTANNFLGNLGDWI